MKVLLACPTYDGKEYAFERWYQAIGRITYQPLHVAVVDNSDTTDFYARWHNKVPMVHIDLRGETPDRKIALSMEYIRTEIFLPGGYSYWLNVEADILVPPQVVDVMLYHAQGVNMVAAPYKHRKEDRWIEGCFGCTLFDRKIGQVSFADAPKDTHTDSWYKDKVMGKFRINELPRHLLRLEHVDA